MKRAARRPTLVVAAATLLLWRALVAPPPAAADDPPDLQAPPSACHVLGEVRLDVKLVCPMQPVAARFRFQATCPGEDGALRVDALRVVAPYPEGIIAYEPIPSAPALPEDDPGAAPDAWRFEMSEDVPPVIDATLWIRPLRPGTYDIGAANVEIVDSVGRRASAEIAPARLVVAEGCRRPVGGPIYLPALHAPACAPTGTPTDLVFVLDRSSSVGRAGLGAELDAIRTFAGHLALGRDRVGLVAFDANATLIAPLDGDAARFSAALERLDARPAAPGTRIDRALDAGLAALGPSASLAPGRRRLLVLISDGVHFGPDGIAPVLRAAAAARAADVDVATIVVGKAPDRALMARLATVPELSLDAGGRDGVDLGPAFRSLAESVAHDCPR